MSDKRSSNKVTLTYSDLEYAYQNCKSLGQAAKFLNVALKTLSREAKLYKRKGDDKTFYELLYNKRGVGISKPKGGNPNLIKYDMESLLQGNHPNYNPYLLQTRLLKNDLYLPRRCSVCSYFEVREDGKIPLKLDFIDGDTTNHKLNNLRWLCFNHYYIYVGGPGKMINRDRYLNKFNPKNIKE